MTRPHAGTPARAWLRWSWRDLRAHWVAVAAIAMVLAIGTGVYAGLGSTAAWRRESNDASFAALAMHDLKVELSPGTFVPEGALLAALEASSPDGDVVAARERLVVWSQVDSAPIGNDDPVLVPARIVGMDFSSEGPVDAVWIREGTIPGAGTGLLETKFAEAHTLPPRGELMVAGGGRLPYTGLGASPEDFFYEGPEGTIFSQSELAILYMPLTTAQRLAGRAGRVNDLVLRIADRTRRDAVRDRLATALA